MKIELVGNLGSSRAIAILEDDRAIATVKTVEEVVGAISDHYCGAKVTVTEVEPMKHIDQTRITVDILDDGEVGYGEFYLQIVCDYTNDFNVPETMDDLNEISLDVVAKFVELGLIPDCTDTNDDTEFAFQDAINEVLAEKFGLDYDKLQE